MLDINLFRDEKNIILIKKSEKKRFFGTDYVDRVVEADDKWKKLRHQLDSINKQNNIIKLILKEKYISKDTAEKKEMDKEYDLTIEPVFNLYKFTKNDIISLSVKQLEKLKKLINDEILIIENDVKIYESDRNKNLLLIGNIVHNDCVVSDDDDDNKIITEWGNISEKEFKHHELMSKLGLNMKSGSKVFGSRGYFLFGDLVLLQKALINYSLDFLINLGFEPAYPPVIMNNESMSKCCQLNEFDEVLYKVSDQETKDSRTDNKLFDIETKDSRIDNNLYENNKNNKYLIATSEQPLTALHENENLNSLPIKYAGISECFRKETGSHKDQNGIFRVHQFTKIEQFCIVDGKESDKTFYEMIGNAEKFYQSLNIPYRVVSIVSGKLNNSASIKYDLEAWFPGLKAYRELVSCSNCTDYQSRKLNIKYNNKYVHMLNSTLCATTRTMCCIVENYQKENGIEIPNVLRKYINKDFIYFK